MAARKKAKKSTERTTQDQLTLHRVYFTPEAVEKINAMARRAEPKGCHMVCTPGEGNTWKLECRGDCPAGSTGCGLAGKDGHYWCACGKKTPPNTIFTP